VDADNVDALNIVFVTHLGDLVEHPLNVSEWENANRSMSILDGHVSWAVLPGNHDMLDYNLTLYNTYFGYDRFSDESWYGGAYKAGDNGNSYQLFSAGGEDYLILHLQYNPSDDILYWASSIIGAYPTRRVVVSTHDYCIGCPNLSKIAVDIGEHIWHSLVKPHADQIFLVLSGHWGVEALRTDKVGDHVVCQLTSDFMNKTNIESGWLRILEFCPSQEKIFVKTYSPLLDTYKTGSQSEFTIDYKTIIDPPARREGTTNENNTIYIRPNGSIDPPTTPIRRNGSVYTFEEDILGSIIIERDNIVIDGAGFTLRGTGSEDERQSSPMLRVSDPSKINFSDWASIAGPDPYISPDSNNTGIYSYAKGLTIKNLTITDCWCAIELEHSSDNIITQNEITKNHQAIRIHYSSNNTISDNKISNNVQALTLASVYDNIQGNEVVNSSEYGLQLSFSFNNISKNNFTNSACGICFSSTSLHMWLALSLNNTFSLNNFVNNTQQIKAEKPHPHEHMPDNAWDNNGQGNYWSDYREKYPEAKEIGNSGIWDTSYVVDKNNIDYHPFMNQIVPVANSEPFQSILVIAAIASVAVFVVSLMVYFTKFRK
jgi:parallel beta-helix repeat protein